MTTDKNEDKVILDLCAGTGEWSRPYALNGYDRRIITLPDRNVIDFDIPNNVYGILAAPPCRDFSVSGAQYWKAKDEDGRTAKSIKIVVACLYIINYCLEKGGLVFWSLESPIGRLPKLLPELLGQYKMKFNPCDYGDPYTKLTCLWGNFNEPVQNKVEPIRVSKQGSWIQKLGGSSARTKFLRSITPSGFAQAFYETNK